MLEKHMRKEIYQKAESKAEEEHKGHVAAIV